MLWSPRAFRDEYLNLVYGKEAVGKGRDENNTASKRKEQPKTIRICSKPFRMIGLFR